MVIEDVQDLEYAEHQPFEIVIEAKVKRIDWKSVPKWDRPIHHYSRLERFRGVLSHLTGGGSVPDKVFEILDDYVIENDLWNTVHYILLDNGLSKYFDRIGIILKTLGHPHCIDKQGVRCNVPNERPRALARGE